MRRTPLEISPGNFSTLPGSISLVDSELQKTVTRCPLSKKAEVRFTIFSAVERESMDPIIRMSMEGAP
jgi:hypothetical protein